MNNLNTAKAILNIQKIKLYVKIGTTVEERQLSQLIYIDVIIPFDNLPKLAITDQISDGVCYAKVVCSVRKFSLKQEFNLIEHFAYMLGDKLRKEFDLISLSIKIYKSPEIQGNIQDICFEYTIK